MSSSKSLESGSIDELLSALADEESRAVLSYFRGSGEMVAHLDALANAVDRRDGAETEQVTVRLHHDVLPRLDEAGVIEYDARTNTARYREQPELETLVQQVIEQ